MKKILNLLLILTGLAGYLEWSGNQHSFLFQIQYELLFGPAWNIKNFLHPAVLLPLAGELILIYTLVQKIPGRILTLIGSAFLSVIMIIILVVGIASANIKVASSSIPFFITLFFVIKYNLKKKKETGSEN
ncbi:MAG: hypothetical protein ACM3PT_13480 [Deltaproteobacteria bacterium]